MENLLLLPKSPLIFWMLMVSNMVLLLAYVCVTMFFPLKENDNLHIFENISERGK
jgi:hypothetical protein